MASIIVRPDRETAPLSRGLRTIASALALAPLLFFTAAHSNPVPSTCPFAAGESSTGAAIGGGRMATGLDGIAGNFAIVVGGSDADEVGGVSYHEPSLLPLGKDLASIEVRTISFDDGRVVIEGRGLWKGLAIGGATERSFCVEGIDGGIDGADRVKLWVAGDHLTVDGTVLEGELVIAS